MFLTEKKRVNFNAAILLFSCFFYAVFATIHLSPISTKQPNNDGSSVKVINGPVFGTRPPSAYSLRIDGCSNLMTKYSDVKEYETRPFSVGGFNWTFILKPFGQWNYLSTYVAIDPMGLVGKNREIYADIRFLIYSKTLDKYLTSTGAIMYFNQSRTTFGYPLISHGAITKEYTSDDDQCVFGVDINVYPFYNKWEVLSFDKTVYGPQSWKFMNFSTMTNEFYVSDEFTVGGKKWALKVYPNGYGTGEGDALSLYVILAGDQTLKPYEKVYVRAILRVLDQKLSRHIGGTILTWVNTPGEGAGLERFAYLSDLRNPFNGYIVNDSLSVQVQFEAISSTSYYSNNAAQFMSII